MGVLRFAQVLMALSLPVAALAEEFDGSRPLECTAAQGHDCLLGVHQCGLLQPEGKRPPVFGVDFAKKEVRSPFRTSVLKVAHATKNSESLVLQGADLLFAWSALINKTTGAITVSIADRKGAYVVFGQCRIAGTE